MKKILFLVCASLVFIGCSDTAPKVSEKPIEKSKTISEKEAETVASHTVEKKVDEKTAPKLSDLKSKVKSKWSRSGNPIDTSKFDEAIVKAESVVKTKPNDENAKKAIANAFYARGFALTQARQYAAAIGDYRKALRYVPDHEESRKWIKQITIIYESLNKEIPPKGEEPAPLEFKKQKS